ncbi:MAG: hypothetical protein LBI79_04280 [Nitrososphaerota archaeon]|nr:hypothetical protein [Nitrososphaerota archaeon]
MPELVETLDELAEEKKYVDIQVCPKCKNPLIRRVSSMLGDMSGHMGLFRLTMNVVGEIGQCLKQPISPQQSETL